MSHTTTPRAARRFPTDEEVAARLVEWRSAGNPASVARADQQAAAVRDNLARSALATKVGVAAGYFGSAAIDRSSDLDSSPVLRHAAYAAAQTLLAAESGGIEILCPHTAEARPLLLCADPPVLACRDCMATERVQNRLRVMGAQWAGQCDRCGRCSESLFPSSLAVDHLTVVSLVCGPCRDMDEAAIGAAREGAHVTRVGRNRPCPCGSGRKFKRCCALVHGTVAEAR